MEVRPCKCHLYVADTDYAMCLLFSTSHLKIKILLL